MELTPQENERTGALLRIVQDNPLFMPWVQQFHDVKHPWQLLGRKDGELKGLLDKFEVEHP